MRFISLPQAGAWECLIDPVRRVGRGSGTVLWPCQCCVSERWGGSHGGQDVVAFTAVYVQCPRCVQLSRGCSASPVVLSAGSSAAAASRSPTGMCLVYSRHHLSLTSYSRSLFPFFLISLFHRTLNMYIAHPLVKTTELLKAASKT